MSRAETVKSPVVSDIGGAHQNEFTRQTDGKADGKVDGERDGSIVAEIAESVGSALMNGLAPGRFALGTFSSAMHRRFPGVVLPCGTVVPVHRLEPLLRAHGLQLTDTVSILGLLSSWRENLAALHAIAGILNAAPASGLADLGGMSLTLLEIHAPVPEPRQIFCTIANYRSHILDTVRDPAVTLALGEPDTAECIAEAQAIVEERLRHAPYVCLKLPTTVIGPNDPLPIPRHAHKLDWELELAAVIGAPCRRATRENAMTFVAGYTLANDITLRELVARPDLPRLGADWLQSKNGPGFLPTGPFLVPADFVADPYAIRLRLRLNGVTMQDDLTSDMIFDIAAQIEHISRHAQMLPGDIVCTGTPAGCGIRYRQFLKPDDVLECSADGFGVQRTPCIAEAI